MSSSTNIKGTLERMHEILRDINKGDFVSDLTNRQLLGGMYGDSTERGNNKLGKNLQDLFYELTSVRDDHQGPPIIFPEREGERDDFVVEQAQRRIAILCGQELLKRLRAEKLEDISVSEIDEALRGFRNRMTGFLDRGFYLFYLLDSDTTGREEAERRLQEARNSGLKPDKIENLEREIVRGKQRELEIALLPKYLAEARLDYEILQQFSIAGSGEPKKLLDCRGYQVNDAESLVRQIKHSLKCAMVANALSENNDGHSRPRYEDTDIDYSLLDPNKQKTSEDVKVELIAASQKAQTRMNAIERANRNSSERLR